VHALVVRQNMNLKGHLLALVLATVGQGKLRKAFEHSIKAIEARTVDKNARLECARRAAALPATWNADSEATNRSG